MKLLSSGFLTDLVKNKKIEEAYELVPSASPLQIPPTPPPW